MPSVQDYESRVRHEAHQTLAPHLQNLREELQALESRISASLKQFEQQVSVLDVVEFSAAGDTLKEALGHVLAKTTEDSAHLARFARDMRRSETQEEILTLLMDGASRYAPRVTLFVLRGEQLTAWASRGYTEEAATAIASQGFPESDSHLLSRALEGDDVVSASDISAESRLVPLLHEEQQGPWHAFPLKALQRPVAVLLATASNGHECELQPLSAMMQITGLCIENVALKILQQLKASGAPSFSPEPAAPVATAAPPQPEVRAEGVAELPQPAAAEQPVPAEEPVAAPPEPVAVEPPAAAPEPVAEPEAAPVMAAQAPQPTIPTPAEEALAAETAPPPAGETAGREAPAVEPTVPEAALEEPSQAVAQARPSEQTADAAPELPSAAVPKPAVPREVQKPSEDERLHSDAKRFARLLVSEIKLYNEQRVAEGRANRDVYVRLKRDIDRSRDMYEKRVSASVSRRVDYFHDELVRILGDNDASALGSDYPGPRVEN